MCTDFRLIAQDKAVICGRSMDFGAPVHSRLSAHLLGETYQSSIPPGYQNGRKWASHHRFIGIDCLGIDIVIDGFNDAGLSFSYLWFGPGRYPSIPNTTQAISFRDLGRWILGNFSRTKDIIKPLKELPIHGLTQGKSPFSKAPPLHASIHDAEGNSLVIEFVEGQIKIHDNPNGVLANGPALEQHLANLRKIDDPKILMNLADETAFWDRSKIPGDASSASRFERLSVYKRYAEPVKTGDRALNLAVHLLNAVDIPQKESEEFTQWSVIKDLTNRTLWIRTYGDMHFKKYDFHQIARCSSI